MTKTTNYKEKRLLGQARGMSTLYMCVSFSLVQIFQFLVTKSSSSSSSFSIPHIWIFIFLLYLNTNHLNPTLGGLRLHS